MKLGTISSVGTLCAGLVLCLALASCGTTPSTPPTTGDPSPPSNPTPPSPPPSSGDEVTVVIDPGHGGFTRVGGSSPNNATSYSGVQEKTMTLEMGQLVRSALIAQAPGKGVNLKVRMTRTGDVNPGLVTRANLARDTGAEILLSIHFNAFNGVARGVETHIRPTSKGNINLSADNALASRIQKATYNALKSHDSGTLNRGVKQTSLAVLNDSYLGNTSSNARVRSCLLEVEFIDVQQVDRVLNVNSNASTVKRDLANAIALAILDDIKANS